MKSKQETQRLDLVAGWYDPHRDFDFYTNSYGTSLILRNSAPGSCLEIGCATGVQTEMLLEKFQRLCVVEGSPQYIDAVAKSLKAKTRGKKVDFVCSLFEQFQTREKFDNIVAAHILEHVNEPVQFLKKCRTLLKRGGILHVIVPNADSFHRQIGVAMKVLKKRTDFSERDRLLGHRRVYTPTQLKSHIHRAGFKIANWEGILLKFVSNQQMESFSEDLIRALFDVGRQYPFHACEMYAKCRPSSLTKKLKG